MNDDIRIWEVDDASKAAKPVESTNRMETEALLEELLVRNPDMLMPGLMLVGRQTPTDSGFLDLLGVDGDGRLVVFELKRERLTRDAVAQAIDYCSWLDSLTEAGLADWRSMLLVTRARTASTRSMTSNRGTAIGRAGH